MDYYSMNWFERNKEENDYGGNLFVVNIKDMNEQNSNFRKALWTGEYLQMTMMCINPYSDIGIEVHPHTDQILIVSSGHGVVHYGKDKEQLDTQVPIFRHSAIFVPAKTYHNIKNTTSQPLKLISIYAPPNHPFGIVQKEKNEQFHY